MIVRRPQGNLAEDVKAMKVAQTILLPLLSLPASKLPQIPLRASICMAAPPAEKPTTTAAAPAPSDAAKKSQEDWGGLPAAITASKAGAINSQLVKSTDAEAVLKLTVKNAQQLNSVNAATALHRIAGHLKKTRAQRDRVLRDQRFESLLDATAELVSQCNPRSVSDILWAFATLQHWPPTMLKPVLTQVNVHLEANAFEAQHLALIVWAFAVLGLKPVKLLERIESSALTQVRYLNQQNCANLLWGFAKLNYKPTTLLPALKAKMLDAAFLERMKPVELSDASYAIAVIGGDDEQLPLLNAFASRATPGSLLTKFTSRQLVLLLWSFARVGSTPPEQLPQWVETIQAYHAQKPLLAADQKNLEAALEKFGEDTEWLHPPKPEDEEGAEVEATAAEE